MSHIEVAYAVHGDPLPVDHSHDLWLALSARSPELAAVPGLAVLPIRAAQAGAGLLVLQRHSRLLVRLPEDRAPLALALADSTLDIGAAAVHLGAARTRPLAAYGSLYATRVASQGADESDFHRDARRMLRELGISLDFVVGRRSTTNALGGSMAGFSLMVSDLPAAQSFLLQAQGLGPHRGLGFGVFVGHK